MWEGVESVGCGSGGWERGVGYIIRGNLRQGGKGEVARVVVHSGRVKERDERWMEAVRGKGNMCTCGHLHTPHIY
jgi:hypothetical protein